MPKADLSIEPARMNAAGALGFTPNEHQAASLKRLGAFVTNPISLQARTPAQGTRFLEYPGGFMLHSGYPNPGLKASIRRYKRRWAAAPLPVLVHLLPLHPRQVTQMLDGLEGLEGVRGVEIGLPPETDPPAALAYAQAAIGELPAILRLPFENAMGLATALATSPLTGELVAISLAPPRGSLPDPQNGSVVSGRLYGPAIFPQALACVRAIAALGLPVIAAGGIYKESQIQAMRAAGALAVQLDSVLWRGFEGEETPA
jgi:dihydroorotate dehydrogenase (NAD+) catalytic subunit